MWILFLDIITTSTVICAVSTPIKIYIQNKMCICTRRIWRKPFSQNIIIIIIKFEFRILNSELNHNLVVLFLLFFLFSFGQPKTGMWNASFFLFSQKLKCTCGCSLSHMDETGWTNMCSNARFQRDRQFVKRLAVDDVSFIRLVRFWCLREFHSCIVVARVPSNRVTDTHAATQTH